jgi:hypothetical protein
MAYGFRDMNFWQVKMTLHETKYALIGWKIIKNTIIYVKKPCPHARFL